MNGPDHYRSAEELLRRAEELLQRAERADADSSIPAHDYLVAAQVHATLALAAASVDTIGVKFCVDEWTEVTK